MRARLTRPAARPTRQDGFGTGWDSRQRSARRELPTNCDRIDPGGRVDLVVTEQQVPDPNGLCFSPDYRKLYVVSTGKGPGDTGPGAKGDMVGADDKLSKQKLFSDVMIDRVKCGPAGVRANVNGNLWCSSNAGRSVGQKRRDDLVPGRKADRAHPAA